MPKSCLTLEIQGFVLVAFSIFWRKDFGENVGADMFGIVIGKDNFYHNYQSMLKII